MDGESRHRLEAFERMLSSVQEQYKATQRDMARLKAEGREKSVTFRQLIGNKLQLQNLLSMYALFGLVRGKGDAATVDRSVADRPKES